MQELGDKLSITNIIGHGCTRIDWKNIDVSLKANMRAMMRLRRASL
jgi:hypothetical protein